MIVITGAAGHIGNVLIRQLLAANKKPIRALVLPDEDLIPLKGLDIEIIRGNILNLDDLLKAFKDAKIVYHLASIIAISRGTEKLVETILAHVAAGKSSKSVACKHGIRNRKITDPKHNLPCRHFLGWKTMAFTASYLALLRPPMNWNV